MNKQQYAELVRETRKDADFLFSDKPEAWDCHLKMAILENPEVNPSKFSHDVRLFRLKRRLRAFQG